MEKKQGLNVQVFRWTLGDCTNGGITSKMDSIVLTGEGIEGPFPPKEGEPYLVLKKKEGFDGQPYIYAVPSEKKPGAGPMMGGNFVYSSDSRFRKICAYPIPVHDRFE